MRLRTFFFFQAEDGIRDPVRSRGLGDVYKRQVLLLEKSIPGAGAVEREFKPTKEGDLEVTITLNPVSYTHLTLPTSDLV